MSFDWNLGQTLFSERGLVTVYSVKDVQEGQKAPNQRVHCQTEHVTSSAKLSLRTNAWLSSMLNALHSRASCPWMEPSGFSNPISHHTFLQIMFSHHFWSCTFSGLSLTFLPVLNTTSPPHLPPHNPSYVSEANPSSVAQRLAHMLFLKLPWPFHLEVKSFSFEYP